MLARPIEISGLDLCPVPLTNKWNLATDILRGSADFSPKIN